ncbi:MAG TPA: DUF2071 domain-containing protein [Tepidisphaeraceae bacterium]|nr:DUF2071 domain-containing protein [Tepidisphaeraceae bacterium]
MLYRLKRHPIPIKAHFEFSLVLAYAFPGQALAPLLPPGLKLDTYEDFGFLAIAMVRTRQLRPSFLPAFLGHSFFLTGYRIFVRHQEHDTGRNLRGLRILRSDTDHRLMAFFGNRLTHYNYRPARVNWTRTPDAVEIDIRTPNGHADLHVRADLTTRPAPLPDSSPFPDLQTARRFAGPLPFTFDYEPQTHSIVKIQGVREHWDPQPIRVDVTRATFFDHPPFNQLGTPRLANAFYLEDVPYQWKRGRRERLPRD